MSTDKTNPILVSYVALHEAGVDRSVIIALINTHIDGINKLGDLEATPEERRIALSALCGYAEELQEEIDDAVRLERSNAEWKERMQVYANLLKGGDWLGRAREWMKSNVRGGDTLTWGSGELVHVPFYKLEELAHTAAVAAVMEDRKKRTGPGTPTARFTRLVAELEARFPHPNPFDSTKTPEEYILEAIDHLISSNAAGTPLGWIPWDGGGQIPHDDTYVVYKMYSGDVELNPRQVGGLDWSRDSNADWEIVAYKVVASPR